MKLERAFRISSILLAAAGFTGMIMTGELPIGLVGLGTAALGLSFAQAAGWGADWLIFRLSPGAWNAIMVSALIGFGADFMWISQDLLEAGVHFLVLLMVNKLLTLKQRKDFMHLYAISLLMVLAAAALTVELWYGAVFVAYLLAAIWTLLLYHLRSEAEESGAVLQAARGPVDPARAPGPITGRFFWSTNAVAMAAFGLTLTIFFIIPRIGAGFFQKGRGELVRTSGFSEKVDLGIIGAIKLDETVVMRVEFPDHNGPLEEGLYFRGAAYNMYDGRSWTNSLARRRVLGQSQGGLIRVTAQDASALGRAGLRQEILVEALDTTVLFGLPFVESIKGFFLFVLADGMGDLYMPYHPNARFQYSVYSTPTRLHEQERTGAAFAYPAHVRKQFLQLPPVSQPVVSLAREVVRQAKTPYEMAAAVERHLRETYRYSLDVGTAVSESPIDDFLFTRKTGYCEHYATAMVVMLRILGIPARLATGFLRGEWNEFGQYYTVRQRDAHAWVEVFFPRSGWMTFDPTPSVPPAGSTPLWSRLGSVVDSVRLKWDRLVILYSFRDQMAIAQDVRERSGTVRLQVIRLVTTASRWAAAGRARLAELLGASDWLLGAVIAAGCLGVAALVAIVRFGGKLWGWRRRLMHQTPDQAAAVRLYGRMLRLLDSRGVTRAAGAAPLEFARLVNRVWPDANPFVEPLTQLYCRVRFGEALLSSEDLHRANGMLAGLRAVRRMSGRRKGFVAK